MSETRIGGKTRDEWDHEIEFDYAADAIDRLIESVFARVAELEAEMDWLWANCQIVHWPKNVQYPIEHNPHARKKARDWIMAEMKKEK